MISLNFIENFKAFTNRDYEFEAELEDHQLGSQTIYRLYYMKYYRKDEYNGRHDNNVGIIDWPFKPFMLPEGMSREDSFKVLSYLTDFIEKKFDLEPCSYKSVAVLDDVLNLERLGFKRLDVSIDDDSKIIDLFTVAGRLQLFKRSNHYQKYFEWYMEDVTLDEVKDIYSKCGIQFYDLEEIKTSSSNPQFVKKKEN